VGGVFLNVRMHKSRRTVVLTTDSPFGRALTLTVTIWQAQAVSLGDVSPRIAALPFP